MAPAPSSVQKILLVGFNENLFEYEEHEDIHFAKQSLIDQQFRAPRIIATYSFVNDPAQLPLQESLDLLVKYQSMPQGVVYTKKQDLVQSLKLTRQNLEQQLS